MTQLPPTPSLFDQNHWLEVKQLIHTLNKNQSLWLSGYLAATAGNSSQIEPSPSEQEQKVVIAFGTETNNCRHLATQFAQRCQQAGVVAEAIDLSTLRIRKLNKLHTLIIITATHGDGDPPEPITDFYEHLMADDAPPLKDLTYAVLALGDSSYEHFCVTGIYIDQRLEALGGKRLINRQDCDVDFEEPAKKWLEELLNVLPKNAKNTALQPSHQTTHLQQYSKNQPLDVEVLSNINLSNPNRIKPIHHIELSLDDPSFSIKPGDAVGVYSDNPPELVALLLDATNLSAEQPVTVKSKAIPLVEALRKHCDLTIPSKNLLTLWAKLSEDKTLINIVESDAKTQRHYLRTHQVRDLLTIYPARPEAQQLVDNLRPLQPRLYDVANCLSVTDDELHLTVKAFSYPFNNRTETGIASHYLLQVQPGDTLQVYPHKNGRFHLPEEKNTPLILICEGTGIAPYRAFLQELSIRDTPPPCWLIFAENHFEEDFLYQLDIQSAYQKGVVTDIDSIFYQDPRNKNLTLATPLFKKSEQLFKWLDQEAHIYFCGDKILLENCEKEVQRYVDEKQNKGYWKTLVKNKRIHRNLY